MCLFISDKTAYFKWIQTSKELKGKASGKRNSRSKCRFFNLQRGRKMDPQTDQHRPFKV